MILACPNCGAQFALDDAALGRAGRRVRCSACRHEWRAEAPSQAEPPPVRPASPAPSAAPVRPEPAGFDAIVLPRNDPPAPPPEPMRLASAPVRTPPPARAARRSGGWVRMGWVLLVLVVALGGAAAGMREPIVCRYPELETYYARFGLASPEANEGLILTGSAVAFETREGARVLVARAEISNVGGCTRRVPLRSLLVDAAGRTRGEAQFTSPTPLLRSGENTVIRLEVRAPPDAVTGVALPDLRHANR